MRAQCQTNFLHTIAEAINDFISKEQEIYKGSKIDLDKTAWKNCNADLQSLKDFVEKTSNLDLADYRRQLPEPPV